MGAWPALAVEPSHVHPRAAAVEKELERARHHRAVILANLRHAALDHVLLAAGLADDLVAGLHARSSLQLLVADHREGDLLVVAHGFSFSSASMINELILSWAARSASPSTCMVSVR